MHKTQMTNWILKILCQLHAVDFRISDNDQLTLKIDVDFTAYDISNLYKYRTRAIITRSRFETALDYKPRILGLKNEEFPFLVHKWSVI